MIINHLSKYDVCIIGAGITGLTCGLELLKKGYKVILLEKDRNHVNASRYNAGQILPGFSLDEISLSNHLERDEAQALWEFTHQGIEYIKNNLLSFSERVPLIPNSYFYVTRYGHFDQLLSQWEKYRNAYSCLHKMKYFSSQELAPLLSTAYFLGGLKESGACILDSMSYMDNMLKNFYQLGGEVKYFAPKIGCSTLARNSNNIKIRVNNRKSILSKYLVIAANGQLHRSTKLTLMNGYFFKTDPLKNIHLTSNLAFSVISSKGYLHYCRHLEDNSMLFCCKSLPFNYSVKELIKMFSEEILPIFPFLGKANIRDFSFSSIALTKRRLPEVGKLSSSVYYAQGYSGRGLVLGSLAGKAISEAVAGDDKDLKTFAKLHVREACHA